MRLSVTVRRALVVRHERIFREAVPVRSHSPMTRRGVIAAAAALLGSVDGAAGQCQYEVVPLDYPIGCGIFQVITIPTGLNNHGAVVGRYYCAISTTALGFLWTPDDGFVTLPLPPGVNDLRADDINDAGAIVGSYSLPTGGGVAFVYQDGLYTELPPPPGSCCISANAIDNQGTVVGAHSLGANPSQPSAYLWSADEGFTYLGVMNGPYSDAGFIGPGGQVTGWTGDNLIRQGFIWHSGRLTIVPPVAVGGTSEISAIAADGLVVGEGLRQQTPSLDPSVGFLWRNGGFLRFIDPIAGFDTSRTARVNAVHQVTGFSLRLDNPDDRRGYLWQHGVTHDLNDLVPRGSLHIQSAGAINEYGQIIAYGLSGHAFLLTPIGRPPGDLDIDCTVGVRDFLRLLTEWGGHDSPADINDDGLVDGLDLAILFDNWGVTSR